MGRRVFDEFEIPPTLEDAFDSVGCLPDVDADVPMTIGQVEANLREAGFEQVQTRRIAPPDHIVDWRCELLLGDGDEHGEEIEATMRGHQCYRVTTSDGAFGLLLATNVAALDLTRAHVDLDALVAAGAERFGRSSLVALNGPTVLAALKAQLAELPAGDAFDARDAEERPVMRIGDVRLRLAEAGFLHCTITPMTVPDRARDWVGAGLDGDPDGEEEIQEAMRHLRYYAVSSEHGDFGVLIGADAAFDLHGTGVTPREYYSRHPGDYELRGDFAPVGDVTDLRRLLTLLQQAGTDNGPPTSRFGR